MGHMPLKLCVPRWSGDFVTLSMEVIQVVEAAFSLKKNPRRLDFITEAALKACRLVPARSFQAVFAASSSTTIPSSAGEIALDLTFDSSGCLNAIKSGKVVFLFIFVCFFFSY